MIECLRMIATSTCANCAEKITRWRGDLGTDSWFHTASGLQACENSPHAEPLEVTMVIDRLGQ